MVDAQKWLDQYFPKGGVCQLEHHENNAWEVDNRGKTRVEITKLDTSLYEDLEGSLDLSDFINLKELICRCNKLASLDLSNCSQLEKIDVCDCLLNNLALPTNPTNLKKLDLSNNNFPPQDLSFLTPCTNLELLRLGNDDRIKISGNLYNRFTGSLDYLSGMEKLTELNISDTDINIGLEYLPDSLKRFYCWTDYRPDAKCQNILRLLVNEQGTIKRAENGWISNFPAKFRAWKKNNPDLVRIKEKVKALEEELKMEREEAAKALEKAKEWRERQLKEITGQKDQQIRQLTAENKKLKEQLESQAQIEIPSKRQKT